MVHVTIRAARTYPAIALLLLLGQGVTARAQSLTSVTVKPTTLDAEVAVLRSDVAELRSELDALRAELLVLRAARQADARVGRPDASAVVTVPTLQLPAVTPEQIEIMQSQLAELSQTKVESASRLPVRLTGTILTHTFYNSGEANWLENPNLSLPSAGANGQAGTMSATVRQSRQRSRSPTKTPFSTTSSRSRRRSRSTWDSTAQARRAIASSGNRACTTCSATFIRR